MLANQLVSPLYVCGRGFVRNRDRGNRCSVTPEPAAQDALEQFVFFHMLHRIPCPAWIVPHVVAASQAKGVRQSGMSSNDLVGGRVVSRGRSRERDSQAPRLCQIRFGELPTLTEPEWNIGRKFAGVYGLKSPRLLRASGGVPLRNINDLSDLLTFMCYHYGRACS